MQLNLGQKIRELRRRDGRTQEALAETLGVSAQAVSRWESGGSYPDMEMIPAIANYFHISIDELFGYHDDREEKIKNILDTATNLFNQKGLVMYHEASQDNIYECIEMLRGAAEEFPNEPQILLKLAKALEIWGWYKYSSRGVINEKLGTIEIDAKYNSQNIFWQEALHVYEKILKINTSHDERKSAIFNIISLYSNMGEYEKAKKLANSQNEIMISKEMLLPMATTGEEKLRYESEKIIELLGHLHFTLHNAIATNTNIHFTEYEREVLLSLVKLYETIFVDGKCGKWHHEIAYIYLNLVWNENKRNGPLEDIVTYFDKAFEHYKEYDRIYHEGEYKYTAPLVKYLNKIEKSSLIPLGKDFWKTEIKNYPESLKEELRKIPKYAECFSE